MQLTVYDSLKRQRLLQTKNETFPSYFLQNLHFRAAAHFALSLDTVIWSINCIINLKTPRSRTPKKISRSAIMKIFIFSRISLLTNNFRVTRLVREKKRYIFLMTIASEVAQQCIKGKHRISLMRL